ncbi:MAG TPA: hypothetical protein VMW35_16135 [Myxococcota bacterium]|jgi:hypothetical protein|nr:hypothetical protein [Myxococcota bacterium]
MTKSSRSALGLALVAILAAPAAGARGSDDGRPPANPATIAVYGDAPYGTSPTDVSQLLATPAFIDSINADPDVSLVIQVGDIHSGKQYCTQAYDQAIFDLWKSYSDPLIYTPGDNETTDCNKKAEGGGAYNAATGQIDYVLDPSGVPVGYAQGDPVANLELIRSIFFPIPNLTLGAHRRLVLSQALAYDRRRPSDRKFVENVLWLESGVLFLTIDLPGGSNNDTDVWYGAPTETAAQTQARTERTGADLSWLDIGFTLAKLVRAKGVVIAAQADMWDPEKGAAHQAGYEPFVQSVASHATDFGGPVLMFNGDSHVYRSDNPLSSTASCTWELASPCVSVADMHPGYEVPNFHRVVVHGSTFPLEWLKLTVDPSASGDGPTSFGPFRWQRQIQP